MKTLRDGKAVMIPVRLKGCKAIGWYIEEYGFAQVSMNITDINATPLHKAFEAVSEEAIRRGVRVMGTEIIGMVPLQVLTDAGKYFAGIPTSSAIEGEDSLIATSIKAMGLDWNGTFVPESKIIEYALAHSLQQQ